MKIGIDISPLSSGHKVRGTGFYLQNLRRALLEYHKDEVFIFFDEDLSEKVDLIHYPYFDPFFLTLPLFKKNKTVVTVHDLTPIVFEKEFPRGKKGEFKWRIQKRRLMKSDAIITDSEASKKDIVRLLNFPEDKVFVIYLAAGEHFKKLEDGEWENEMRKRFNLPEKFALYVGDSTWNKNLPNLVDAIKRIDIPLVMVGKALANPNIDKGNAWNKDLVYVQTHTQEDKNFIKLGFLTDEELVKVYNLATLFIMPSFYEGFGLPVLEAMACATPVVTSDRGSLPEVAGDSAIVVNPESVSEMIKAIGKLFTNSDLQKEYSKKALINAKKFSWKKTADETVKVYKKIINE